MVIDRKRLVAAAAFVMTLAVAAYGLRAADDGARGGAAARQSGARSAASSRGAALPRPAASSPAGPATAASTTLAPPVAAPEEPQHPTIAREAAAAEAAAREKILNSDEWHEVERAWQQWLSVQQIYDKNDLAQLRREFHNRIARMNSRELADFLEDMKEKIAVLLSPEAQKARVWLGQYIAVHAVIPKAEFKKKVPDVAHMTSEQIEESLQAWQARRASVRQTQAAFDEGRKQQISNIEAAEERNRQAQERALDRAAMSANNSGPLTAGPGSPYSPPPVPQMPISLLVW